MSGVHLESPHALTRTVTHSRNAYGLFASRSRTGDPRWDVPVIRISGRGGQRLPNLIAKLIPLGQEAITFGDEPVPLGLYGVGAGLGLVGARPLSCEVFGRTCGRSRCLFAGLREVSARLVAFGFDLRDLAGEGLAFSFGLLHPRAPAGPGLCELLTGDGDGLSPDSRETSFDGCRGSRYSFGLCLLLVPCPRSLRGDCHADSGAFAHSTRCDGNTLGSESLGGLSCSLLGSRFTHGSSWLRRNRW